MELFPACLWMSDCVFFLVFFLKTFIYFSGVWGGGACTMTHLRESQGTYSREFSAPTVWGVRIKLGPSGLVVIASLPWAISPVLDFSFWGAGMHCSWYTNALPLSPCRILASILLLYNVSKVWYILIYLVCVHGRHGSHMEARGQEETLRRFSCLPLCPVGRVRSSVVATRAFTHTVNFWPCCASVFNFHSPLFSVWCFPCSTFVLSLTHSCIHSLVSLIPQFTPLFTSCIHVSVNSSYLSASLFKAGHTRINHTPPFL